ncbi:MAG TPA: type VI secretion system-associated protein TagF [Novosphingobium sp.]|nr:type VI secretion system-associated protein TagF [Novosphingobium sp.]
MKMFSSAPAPGATQAASPTLAASPRPAGPWLFGKLPAHGDFISRGLPPELREQLDLWLSAELAAARARFVDFDERYRLAPPWHFVDRDAAGAWSGGALCLSVDAVGRRFPILLAAPAADATDAVAKAWALLELVFSALGESWDAARLHEALTALVPTPTADAASTAPVWAIEAEDGTRVETPGRFPAGLIERMLELAE